MLFPKLWQIPTPDYTEQALKRLQQTLDERLQHIAAQKGEKIMMHSLAVEDMIIMDSIDRLKINIKITAIDTLMLNDETLSLLPILKKRFQTPLHIIKPDAKATQEFEQKHGKYPMYDSIELRKACCFIRKVEPLNRALKGASAWITGQRRSQSITRAELQFAEQDEARHMAKYNPIFDFSEEDVWAYAHAFELPLNPLYHKGYPSIGCAPCSKAIRQDEDLRAGRWWWESADKKECGLHVHA